VTAKSKHKAYEFAIKLMEGFVLHGCTNGHYVPLYLTPYTKAIKYFPSFLKASTSNGYHVPGSLFDLMDNLFNVSECDRSKERLVKDNDFAKSLKEHSRKYLSASHPSCNKETCSKVSLPPNNIFKKRLYFLNL